MIFPVEHPDNYYYPKPKYLIIGPLNPKPYPMAGAFIGLRWTRSCIASCVGRPARASSAMAFLVFEACSPGLWVQDLGFWV